MAQLITLKTYSDERGSLTVFEKELPFQVKRLFWIYNLNDQTRGQHRHLQTTQALICLQGACEVLVKKYGNEEVFKLDKEDQVLILDPQDWHQMRDFKNNAVLLVAASHHYDPKDYIKTPLE